MARLGTDAHRYAMEAKYRLLKNNYRDDMKDKGNRYYVNERQLSDKETAILFERVREIMASEEFVVNPLSKLILDEKEFSLMDEDGKSKYMLELSKIYIEIKNKII